ncbi:hypothetical protein SAMN05421503_2527 [Terribacillus aidingensis]|uniref:Regulatory protein YrvL n=1 Tax=Terribacillus aidingensis TaxID=586416 RepID=A0A285NZM4_9BACI|nr:hypothetical protein SAMN05421503_2527 [Terribacillus aidingensis]
MLTRKAMVCLFTFIIIILIGKALFHNDSFNLIIPILLLCIIIGGFFSIIIEIICKRINKFVAFLSVFFHLLAAFLIELVIVINSFLDIFIVFVLPLTLIFVLIDELLKYFGYKIR